MLMRSKRKKNKRHKIVSVDSLDRTVLSLLLHDYTDRAINLFVVDFHVSNSSVKSK